MRMRMVVATMMLLGARQASAQGWVQLGPGQYGWGFNLITSGVFTCTPLHYQAQICQPGPTPGSITLTSGGGALTLGFSGLSTFLTATNVGQRAAVGSITKSVTGPFTVPFIRNEMLFTFQLFLTESGPLSGTDSWLGGYSPKGGSLFQRNCCDGYGRPYAVLPVDPTAPPLPPLFYTGVAFDQFVGTTFDGTEGDVEVTALYGVAPEPATFALVAPALLGIGWWRRRRLMSGRP